MNYSLDQARRAFHSAEARTRRIGLAICSVFTATRREAMLTELDALIADAYALRAALAVADVDPEPIPGILARHASVMKIDHVLRGRA